MAVREILLLGNPDLHQTCTPVERHELDAVPSLIDDLRDTLLDFRRRHRAGRAIAAPQIGVFKRVVYMETDAPVVYINPALVPLGSEQIVLWDDCMSFPDLLVRVRRHRQCRITYRDERWNEVEEVLRDDMSELLQHECDHLDGILAVSRAIDERSFALRSQIPSSRIGIQASSTIT
ncbi:MAG: peptide deformylase [Rhodothermia bacterium]|nr:peptide deformylase [Rhodothermia bacterium]